MSLKFTKGHESERDKNVPPIQAGLRNRDKNVLPIVDTYLYRRGDKYVDRRGFLTPPEGFSGEKEINYGRKDESF